MKRIVSIFILVCTITTNTAVAQDFECSEGYKQYYKPYAAENFVEAFPLWEKVYENCKNWEVNVYNHGSRMVGNYFLPNTSGEVQEKYKKLYTDIYENRIKNFPEDKYYNEGLYLYYALAYGIEDSLTVYKKLDALIDKADAAGEKLPESTLYTHFVNTYTLYGKQKLEIEDYFTMYDKVTASIRENIQLRQNIIGPLNLKKLGVTDSLGTVIKQPEPLNAKEQQELRGASATLEQLQEYDSLFKPYYYAFINCESVDYFIRKDWDAKSKDTIWVTDMEALKYKIENPEACGKESFAMIDKAYIDIVGAKYVKNDDEDEGLGGSDRSDRKSKSAIYMQSGQWSKAIAELKKEINEVSGGVAKGKKAFNIANCYYKLGNYGSAKSYANQALSYDSTNGKPYMILARIVAKNAGCVDGNTTQKKAAYWVAADLARRGAAIDGRVRSYGNRLANSYEANGPSSKEVFTQGWSKGQTITVGGCVGRSTRVR